MKVSVNIYIQGLRVGYRRQTRSRCWSETSIGAQDIQRRRGEENFRYYNSFCETRHEWAVLCEIIVDDYASDYHYSEE